MKIETKYNIGDWVYVILRDNFHIVKRKILSINIGIFGKSTGLLSSSEIIQEISYFFGNAGTYKENNIFNTKEEALDFINKENEIDYL